MKLVFIGLDIKNELVGQKFINYSKKYIPQEKEAERDKLGLWQGTFEKPWNWRKNEKKK